MEPNPLRGEVAFPLFDDKPGFESIEPGTVLRYRTGDLVQLRQVLGENYKARIVMLLDEQDPVAIIECLKKGLKKAGGDKVLTLGGKDWEDLPFTLSEAVPLIDDALCFAWSGRPASEIRAEIAEKQAEMAKDMFRTLDDPDEGDEEVGESPPVTGSSEFLAPQLGPEKDLTSSGG